MRLQRAAVGRWYRPGHQTIDQTASLASIGATAQSLPSPPYAGSPTAAPCSLTSVPTGNNPAQSSLGPLRSLSRCCPFPR